MVNVNNEQTTALTEAVIRRIEAATENQRRWLQMMHEAFQEAIAEKLASRKPKCGRGGRRHRRKRARRGSR